jgi:hypothetical protein
MMAEQQPVQAQPFDPGVEPPMPADPAQQQPTEPML